MALRIMVQFRYTKRTLREMEFIRDEQIKVALNEYERDMLTYVCRMHGLKVADAVRVLIRNEAHAEGYREWREQQDAEPAVAAQ